MRILDISEPDTEVLNNKTENEKNTNVSIEMTQKHRNKPHGLSICVESLSFILPYKTTQDIRKNT